MFRRLVLLIGTLGACGNDRAVEEVDDSSPAVVPARIRLLTDAQYANSVHDLLGEDIIVPPLQSPGTHPHQFIHDDVLSVDAPLLVQYRIAAETIAHQIEMSLPVPCGAGDSTCTAGWTRDLAERAFRRPLEADELAQLVGLYAQGGHALVAEAVLQAPSFIYRTEVGTSSSAPVVDLTSYELASELSFLFLDSIPDATLWAAAKNESLLQGDVLEHEVDRLLELPRVRAHVTDVVLDWLGVPAVLEARKDPALYPELTPELREAMYKETEEFVSDVLWRRGGSLRELLLSDTRYEKRALDEIYSHDRGKRSGILTHASVLTLLASEQSESIIRRGMFIRHKFLCLPDPGRPPFSAIVAESSFTHAMTESQFSFFRLAHVYCSGCHTSIDPAGRALHRFDALGRWRETDEIDSPVETETTIDIAGERREINGAIELSRALADSPHVARCVVDQLANHAYGRPLTDPSAQGYLHVRFGESGEDLVEVFRALATSPAFRHRRGAP